MASSKHKLDHRVLVSFGATFLLLVLHFVNVTAQDEDDDEEVGETWTYKRDDPRRGPRMWHLHYPACGGKRQSPILIDTRRVIYDPNLRLFDFSEHNRTEGVQMTLENVGGHTVELIVSGREIILKGGSLPGRFRLTQLHFHWGDNNRRGSEHSINGRFFPLEVHFVHKLVDAIPGLSQQSLAVVAFFFKVGRTTNDKYEQMLQHFPLILNPNAEVHIPSFPLRDLFPVSKNYHYFRYNGSLTTPPCYENVFWSIMWNKIIISRNQLNQFRRLFDKSFKRLVDVYRPIQEINNRTIYTTKRTIGRGVPVALRNQTNATKV